jgi:hypothetical protein
LPPRAESEAEYPVFADDEYRALMLAEFGPLMPLLSRDEIQATILTDDAEIHAPPLLPEDDDLKVYPPIPPCPADSKKRKNPPQPPQPSAEEDAVDEPSPRPSKRPKLPSPRRTNKMMATCLLKRSHSAPEPWESGLWCHCNELPRPCALHQNAPGWRWMKEHDQKPPVGSDDGITVPKSRTDGKRLALRYMRWRCRVWMPSRFYAEHAQLIKMKKL